MFGTGVGFGELVIIGIVLLLVVGPQRLPDVAKDVGKGLRTIRRVGGQLRDSAEVDEIKRAVYGGPEGPAPVWKRPMAETLAGLVEDVQPVLDAAKAVNAQNAAGALRVMEAAVMAPQTVATTAQSAAPLDHGNETDDEPHDGRPVARTAGPQAAALAALVARPPEPAAPAPPPALENDTPKA